MLAVYPDGVGDACRRFEQTDELLRSVGVPTPSILASRCEAAWMLLEDLGEATWFESPGERPWSEVEPVYRRAVRHALVLEALDRSVVASLNPALDAAALRNELEITREFALEPERLTGDGETSGRLQRALTTLCERLEAGGLVPSHRDFMVRNLVISDRREVIVLDHQDLRLAPRGYDLASLFNDSLFPPADAALALVLGTGCCSDLQYRRAVAQRCLKAVGSFRRASRAGRGLREPLVRPTLARAWDQFPHVPELAPLVPALERRWEDFLG